MNKKGWKPVMAPLKIGDWVCEGYIEPVFECLSCHETSKYTYEYCPNCGVRNGKGNEVEDDE